jgi:DNA-binding CsgD family transcriptional regulator
LGAHEIKTEKGMAVMENRVLDFMTRLSRTTSFLESWEVYLDELTQLGFSRAMYGYSVLPDEWENVADNVTYITNKEPEYMKEYADNSFIARDPMAMWCVTETRPMVWGWSENRKDLPQNMEKLVELHCDFEMDHCVVIPLRMAGDVGRGGVGMSAAGVGVKEFHIDLKRDIPYVELLTQLFDNHVRRFLQFFDAPTPFDRIYEPLTEKEIETVKWLAHGYNIKQIADEKLYRSINSVDKYISSSKIKLRAINRENLVAKALVLGFI